MRVEVVFVTVVEASGGRFMCVFSALGRDVVGSYFLLGATKVGSYFLLRATEGRYTYLSVEDFLSGLTNGGILSGLTNVSRSANIHLFLAPAGGRSPRLFFLFSI